MLLRRHGPALGVVLIIALALRLLWIAEIHPDPMDGRFDDTAFYRGTAHFIAQGEGYINPAYATPTAAWPPGYPAFLGAVFKLFGEGTTQTYVANALLATATVALAYVIGVMLFGRWTALIAAVALAVWPGQIYFTSLTLSEPLFTLLFVTGFALMLAVPRTAEYRAAIVIAFAIVTVLAMLTRGQAALLLPLAVVTWRLGGMRWRPIMRWGTLAAVVMVVALAPWVARNQRQMGSPVIIATNVGINVWLGHHEGASGRMNVTGEQVPVPDDPNLSREAYEVEASNLALRKGVRYMLTHPVDELRLSREKIRAIYESDATALDWNSAYDPNFYSSQSALLFMRRLANGFWFAALALAVFGVLASRARLSDTIGVLPLTVLAWTAAHLLFFGDSRFHYPIVFIVALLAARAVVVLFETVRRPQPSLGGRYAAA